MYTPLYIAATVLFVVGVVGYGYVAFLLSQDIAAGRVPVRFEEKKS